MPPQDRWIAPPADLDPASVFPRAVRGAQAALIRGALLATHDSNWSDGFADRLSPSARRLLRSAPLPQDWVPVEDMRALLQAADPHRLPLIQGTVARLIAEQAAGRLEWFQLDSPLLSGGSPRDLLSNVPLIYDAYFQGGSARMDASEDRQGWVSLWVEELWPGWALHEATVWFKRALEGQYGVLATVTYLPPPPDRPWWHRYHLSWS